MSSRLLGKTYEIQIIGIEEESSFSSKATAWLN